MGSQRLMLLAAVGCVAIALLELLFASTATDLEERERTRSAWRATAAACRQITATHRRLPVTWGEITSFAPPERLPWEDIRRRVQVDFTKTLPEVAYSDAALIAWITPLAPCADLQADRAALAQGLRALSQGPKH